MTRARNAGSGTLAATGTETVKEDHGAEFATHGGKEVQKTWCSQLHLVVNSCLENQQTDCCGSGKQSLFEEEGKTQHKMASKQQAIGTTLCEELQASNCIYKSQIMLINSINLHQ